jgi:hypothetical protein
MGVRDARTGGYEVIDNRAMSTAQSRAPRKSSDNVATIVLAALHAVLVPVTMLLTVAFLVFTEDDPHDQCRIHNLGCNRGAHVREAVLISVVGSAALIILELVLTTRLLRKRQRLSFVVPLLCCIGQFTIVVAVLSLGSTGMA